MPGGYSNKERIEAPPLAVAPVVVSAAPLTAAACCAAATDARVGDVTAVVKATHCTQEGASRQQTALQQQRAQAAPA
jgi:hypothetical protein